MAIYSSTPKERHTPSPGAEIMGWAKLSRDGLGRGWERHGKDVRSKYEL
jgi:hypothetical protein